MKKQLVCFLLLSCMARLAAAQDLYVLDTKASSLYWKGTKFTGFHEGNVPIKEGSLHAKGNQLTGGSVTIDMNGMTCTDIAEAEDNKSLMDHLKNTDFFDVATHPTATLVIVSVKPLAAATADAPSLHITAKLTIKGVVNTVEFDAITGLKAGVLTAQAAFTIDRTKWGINYKSKTLFPDLANKFIYDDIEFKVMLQARKFGQ